MRTIKFLTLLSAVMLLLLYYLNYLLEKPGPLADGKNIIIPKGGVELISKELLRAKTIETPWIVVIGAKFGGFKTLKSGEYAIPAGASVNKILEIISSGATVIRKITVREGLTVRQIIKEISEADALEGEITIPLNEGEILPETYHYSYGENRNAILKRMLKARNEVLDIAWKERAPELPLKNKQEAIILASIVEKETGLATERPRIAAVFINRLRRGMKLQADPTVIYGKDKTIITRDDLNEENPYNTYVIEGLPIGPICNPGKASIQAVLRPLNTDELYFVADGTGGHVFAKTLAEHNKNVARWRNVKQQK